MRLVAPDCFGDDVGRIGCGWRRRAELGLADGLEAEEVVEGAPGRLAELQEREDAQAPPGTHRRQHGLVDADDVRNLAK